MVHPLDYHQSHKRANQVLSMLMFCALQECVAGRAPSKINFSAGFHNKQRTRFIALRVLFYLNILNYNACPAEFLKHMNVFELHRDENVFLGREHKTQSSSTRVLPAGGRKHSLEQLTSKPPFWSKFSKFVAKHSWKANNT